MAICTESRQPPEAPAARKMARRYELHGPVQGVGFRPFVYRLANALNLRGRVWNADGRVFIEVEGALDTLQVFERHLTADSPTHIRPTIAAIGPIDPLQMHGFSIESSPTSDDPMATPRFPLDRAMCDACLTEMNDPENRRHGYAFTHCNACGPRYSIMTGLPYDRERTTLAAFPMCAECAAEYGDPANRRFHAQGIGCPSCGPQIHYRSTSGDTIRNPQAALIAALDCLRDGGIVAVHGVGGYHLMADATQDQAVATLRARKRRPDKPLAVMVPWDGKDGLDAVRELAEFTECEAEALCRPERPIVLLRSKAKQQASHRLSAQIAPGLHEVGLILPYAPIHHLMLSALDRPLVATSGNISGEPIIINPEDAEAQLTEIADGFLHHDRRIVHPLEDGIYRRIAGRMRPIRLGRGATPLIFDLPLTIESPLLAVGAEQRNTTSLAWRDQLLLSPHLGDLSGFAAQQRFIQQTAELPTSVAISARRVCHDRHPDYASTRWAKASGLECRAVAHHHAHASALCAEKGRVDTDTLVFTWDGTGLGTDDTLWGGETFYGRPGAWRRVASFAPFLLPGGDAAIRSPWRLAQSLAWACGLPWRATTATNEERQLLQAMLERGLNSPPTSSVGRLFDAAVALLRLVENSTHESQAPSRLESVATEATTDSKLYRSEARNAGEMPPVDLPIEQDSDDLLRVDWRPLIQMMTDETRTVPERAADFHHALAHLIHKQVRLLRQTRPIEVVGLCGGVFQNRLLTEAAVTLLAADGIEVLLPERLPANDAAISFGQIIEGLVPETNPGRCIP